MNIYKLHIDYATKKIIKFEKPKTLIVNYPKFKNNRVKALSCKKDKLYRIIAIYIAKNQLSKLVNHNK